MVHYQAVDRTLAALADPTRRAVLERLGRGDATITELAAPFGMTLTGMKKHVRLLEEAELVATSKVGRRRLCRLGERGLDDLEDWIETYRLMVDERLERFGAMLERTKGDFTMTADTHARTNAVTRPTDRDFELERVFDAPRTRVFAAFTDPALIPEWWGSTTVVERMDVRPGGAWRFLVETPTGEMVAFQGEFIEVVVPERIVQTFEGWQPGRSHLETYTFEDLGPQTRVSTRLTFETAAERDHALAEGADRGTIETYARLDELLTRIAGR